MNQLFDLKIEKQKLSEKSHYPLWKILNFPKTTADTIILGDSRALALKDKYWKELGKQDAYNFAYGGATVYEISDTFEFIKNTPSIKHVIIGIQLRSLNLNFKKGMNRVPEAIRLSSNPLAYYSNGFISQISWQHLQHNYFNNFSLSNMSFFSKVHAAEMPSDRDLPISSLLNPIYCDICVLPKDIEPIPHIIYKPKSQLALEDYGIWNHLWTPYLNNRNLPKKFDKQVTKNAKHDWEGFRLSESLLSKIEDIARWCKQNNKQLIFFIPPTITEMQQQIMNYGFAKNNHNLLVTLSHYGLVVDFDFKNNVTENLAYFNDAYHFNHVLAKSIVGELSLITTTKKSVIKVSRKRRSRIVCPVNKEDITNTASDGITVVSEGKNCRFWRSSNETK